jgi:hypothetical protein
LKTNIAIKGKELLNPKRRADQQVERNIELVAHTQTLAQQKQLNGRNHHMPLNISTEC